MIARKGEYNRRTYLVLTRNGGAVVPAADAMGLISDIYRVLIESFDSPQPWEASL